MKLTRKSDVAQVADKPTLGISRRQFMKQAGIATGSIAAASLMGTGMMRRVEAKDMPHDTPIEVKRTICTHCAVGCGLYAEVQNGVWTGQEPAFDHPFNAGGHCAKGAALREHGHGEKRLKYPMKLVDGKWKKISWEDAINEVGDQMLNIRKESGPDSVYFMGSAKFSNEGCYMYRKLAAMWGTNNIDHSARICHSTTVAGVANTWGYGAQTNSFNDIQNSNAIFIIGANPAEAHPVSMQHILTAKEKNNAKIIVVEPRFSRTAAHADLHCAIRPGTDIPFIYGMLWHIFENGWEDKTFIQQRVFEMETIREEVKKYPPKEVANITGVSEEKIYQAAKLMADNRPGCVVWSMGGTQHHVGNANTRAYCLLQLALGNMGVSGGGTNIFRGHDNVQGSTDFGLLFDSLPGYYGLTSASWAHWANVWDLDMEWIKGRFDQTFFGPDAMTKPGIPCSRWHDGVLDENVKKYQKDNIRMALFWGQSVNTETRQREVRDALDKMDTIVVVDPFPTMAGVMHRRKNGVYLLPAATQFETYGSVTNSGRSLQWREQVIQPLFESKTDIEIMYRLAQKLGFSEEYTKHIAKENDLPVIEDITREFNRGMWTIGYTGQSPERIKLHTQNWGTFSNKTLEAVGGPAKGETYGLPWPCWGTPEQKHPGTQILYNTNRHVLQGGGNFRARYGVEYKGKNLLAEGSFSKDAEIQDGYPEFTADMLKQLGWWDDLTAEEKIKAEGKNWKTDISGGIQRVAMKHGCIPFGNAKARCIVWTFPDQVPVHREPIYTTRRDLVAKYPTYDDMQVHRLPTLYKTLQEKDLSQQYPLALSSGRLVEYEGGGEETRSNPWLAELQQEMFVEINPGDAVDRGICNGDDVWLEGGEGGRIKIKALVTPRVQPGVTWMPFHFAGVMHGESLAPNYPEGTVPYVIGESCNTALTYGYDPVTQMQETKASICQIVKA